MHENIKRNTEYRNKSIKLKDTLFIYISLCASNNINIIK